jgi:hypothetical protein
MKSSREDLPVVYDSPQGVNKEVIWGDMSVSAAYAHQTYDAEQMYKGLPDDRCQSPHWGYVIKGKLRAKFADHEEVYEAGDLYYIPPGHTPAVDEGTEFIEFSPAEELRKTQEAFERNLQAMQ